MAQFQICVLGLGYIGLPTASILATRGIRVLGVDIRKELIDKIRSGSPHIEEPGLKALVNTAVGSGHFTVALKPQAADVFMICVPTPWDAKKRQAGLNFVQDAAQSIVSLLRPGNLVILESTVPPGTTDNVLLPILEKSGYNIPDDLFVAYCPERVLPGQILTELVSNDRIIGGADQTSAQKAKSIYSRFVTGNILLTSTKIAETVKLAENTFRDINIAYANELEVVCHQLGINVWEVIRLANRHPRVRILEPGPGVGGHCIAVDPWFLVQAAPKASRLIRAAREINDAKPKDVIRRLDALRKTLPHPKAKIACLGITYKANVDDTRESPALHIVQELKKRKDLALLVVDPYAQLHRNGEFLFTPLKEAINQSDAILLLVNHREFVDLDWAAIIEQKGRRHIIDCRGVIP